MDIELLLLLRKSKVVLEVLTLIRPFSELQDAIWRQVTVD